MTYQIRYRIVNRMKVTALIPNKIVSEVRQYAGGSTLTESLIVALKEWLALKKLMALNRMIEKRPLQFNEETPAYKIRLHNRKR